MRHERFDLDSLLKSTPLREVAFSAPVAPERTLYVRHLKRLFDICLALSLLPIVAPIIGVLWGLARLEGGIGFYGHPRVRQDGRIFTCWKIRTMPPNAASSLWLILASNPRAAQQWKASQKLDPDPRVTPLGTVLRKSGLDELPQIWNILKGEMSFVGPRPITIAELDRYGESVWAYSATRPGLTGFWQTSDRTDLRYADRIEMDKSYAQSISFLLDCKLILRTIGTLLRLQGK